MSKNMPNIDTDNATKILKQYFCIVFNWAAYNSVCGETINNLRYADDTVLIADSAEGLQELIDRMVEACGMEWGMRLNCKKTKILMVSKNNEAQYHQFRANNESLETADTITYLGCSLNKEWDHSREIRCRIEKPELFSTALERSYVTCTWILL